MKAFNIRIIGTTFNGKQLEDVLQVNADTATEALLRLTNDRLNNIFMNKDSEAGVYFKPLAFKVEEREDQ